MFQYDKFNRTNDSKKQLIKEIAELKEANEILKDAMSFFVKDRRK